MVWGGVGGVGVLGVVGWWGGAAGMHSPRGRARGRGSARPILHAASGKGIEGAKRGSDLRSLVPLHVQKRAAVRGRERADGRGRPGFSILWGPFSRFVLHFMNGKGRIPPQARTRNSDLLRNEAGGCHPSPSAWGDEDGVGSGRLGPRQS